MNSEFIQFKQKFEKEPVLGYKNSITIQPKVSVIITTYEHENYIEKAIQSVIEQKTHFPFEIIIIDDHSKDNSFEIAKKLADSYPDKIKLFKNSRKNNIRVDGKPTGRFSLFWGFFHAQGEYIASLDGDDYWVEENKLQIQADYLDTHASIDLVATRFYTTSDGKDLKEDLFGELFKDNDSPIYFNQSNFFNRFYVRPSSVMYRNPRTIKMYQKYKYLRANTIFFELLKFNGKEGVLIPDFTTVYRIHPTGVYSGLSNFQKKYMTYITKYDVFKHNKKVFKNSPTHQQLKVETRYLLMQSLKQFKIKKSLIFLKRYLNLTM